MEYIPLWRCAPSPFSLSAARCGKGDAAVAAGRPLLGGCWAGPRGVSMPRGRLAALNPWKENSLQWFGTPTLCSLCAEQVGKDESRSRRGAACARRLLGTAGKQRYEEC